MAWKKLIKQLPLCSKPGYWFKKKSQPWFKIWLTPILVLIIGIISLISFFLSSTNFNQTKQELIFNPDNLDSHLALAQEFLENNQFAQAEKELLLSQQLLNQQTNHHQSQATGLQWLWQKRNHTDPEAIKNLISNWETIVKQKPDYRDGWIQLAFLHYLLKEDQSAQETLTKALVIDPHSQTALKLEKLINRVGK